MPEAMDSGRYIGILLLGIASRCLTIALQYTYRPALLRCWQVCCLSSCSPSTGFRLTKVRPSNLAIAGLLLGPVGGLFPDQADKLQYGWDQNLIGARLIAIGNLAWAVLLSGRLSLPGQVISSGMRMLVGSPASNGEYAYRPVTLFTLVQAAKAPRLYAVSVFGLDYRLFVVRVAGP